MAEKYEDDERLLRAESPIERHFQTGISTVLIGLVVWVGMSVSEGQETIARLDERVQWLTTEVRGFRLASDGYLSVKAADRRFAQVYNYVQGVQQSKVKINGAN